MKQGTKNSPRSILMRETGNSGVKSSSDTNSVILVNSSVIWVMANCQKVCTSAVEN